MKRRRPPISAQYGRSPNGRLIAAFLACFCAGVLTDWWLRANGPPLPAGLQTSNTLAREILPAAPNVPAAPNAPAESPSPEMPRAKFQLPIEGMDIESLNGGFAERRGNHPHDAVDIMAPRHTPVHAVQDGEIARLFLSNAGGNTIYQYDPTGHLCYYYAHLQRYAQGLHEGVLVKQGDVIGYVGTSGNAPPNAPHLHFAVFEVASSRRWWDGRPIDPYLFFRDSLNH
jgi:murein DD-endopeptidase MepM/ murein hydrolase activator NlpD